MLCKIVHNLELESKVLFTIFSEVWFKEKKYKYKINVKRLHEKIDLILITINFYNLLWLIALGDLQCNGKENNNKSGNGVAVIVTIIAAATAATALD